MLKKIVSIKNIGRFLNASASGDVTFGRYNLIFAENGRGKTTLCAVLRSLQSGLPDHIQGRATLGHTGTPEAQILAAPGLATFANGTWDRLLPELAVFDATFVTENVYSGDAVETGQRRNLYHAIIGSQGVALARRIEDLDAQIRAKNTEIRESRAEATRYAPPGVNLDVFLGLAKDEDIDARIKAKESDLASALQADRIRERGTLDVIQLPALPAAIDETLSKTVEGVAVDAQRLIADHMAAHYMGARGQPWLIEGFDFLQEEDCPFCGQSLSGIALIDAYKGFFGEAYRALRAEVAAMADEVAADFGDAAIAKIESAIVRNGAAVDFWKEHSGFEPPAVSSDPDLPTSLRSMRSAALATLERKAAAPLDPVIPDASYQAAALAFHAVVKNVAAYNAAIERANTAITERKERTAATNINTVQAKLTHLGAQKVRHTEEASTACKVYLRNQIEKTDLENAKTVVRNELDQHTGRVIAQYGNSINQYLDRINAGFEITTPEYNYRGGLPSSSYKIVINKTAVELGDADTPISQPSFKNTLSSGDRSTLALAFFLAELEQDPGRSNKIVVFDDPFTSQDSFRRNHTAYQIKRTGQECAQTVVLSHDPHFLKLIWDKVAPGERKTLQLARVGEDNTTIAEWDIEKAVQAQYRADLATIHAYYAGREGDPRDVIQKIRPLLEGYCRNLYPSQFSDADTLGLMIGKIRAAGSSHPLAAIVDDLEEINEYCRRYHHAENANAATEPVDDNELRGYIKRTLRIVGALA